MVWNVTKHFLKSIISCFFYVCGPKLSIRAQLWSFGKKRGIDVKLYTLPLIQKSTRNDIFGKLSFLNSKLGGFLWFSGTKTINLGLWDHFTHFQEIPHFHIKCRKLPKTNISLWDVKNWPPGHKKMQGYWFAAIILSKLGFIGLQGVKWWIWAVFQILKTLIQNISTQIVRCA